MVSFAPSSTTRCNSEEQPGKSRRCSVFEFRAFVYRGWDGWRETNLLGVFVTDRDPCGLSTFDSKRNFVDSLKVCSHSVTCNQFSAVKRKCQVDACSPFDAFSSKSIVGSRQWKAKQRRCFENPSILQELAATQTHSTRHLGLCTLIYISLRLPLKWSSLPYNASHASRRTHTRTFFQTISTTMAPPFYPKLSLPGTFVPNGTNPNWTYPNGAQPGLDQAAASTSWPTKNTWVNIAIGIAGITGVGLQILFADRIAQAVHRQYDAFKAML
ncbi:hypothetical protein BDV96DRAFT_171365 [Lophiotrema nucula]|uniref:Uncharacterized protein n=1 Tax=Lophiotrema nucula TaxID=690887 RepID=A0A6A5Z1B6_9PLEO|nr:hypothetical protein BDV96DRAFT_171365 [Lophiotrema nucula]